MDFWPLVLVNDCFPVIGRCVKVADGLEYLSKKARPPPLPICIKTITKWLQLAAFKKHSKSSCSSEEWFWWSQLHEKQRLFIVLVQLVKIRQNSVSLAIWCKQFLSAANPIFIILKLSAHSVTQSSSTCNFHGKYFGTEWDNCCQRCANRSNLI